jgi:large subunit ribosomal protein L3
MNKFILGKKIGMTQVFDENGTVIPVTVIQAGPCAVVQKKTVENDGYTAVKLGFEDVPEKKLNRPEKGLFSKINTAPKKYLREFRTEDIDRFEIGQQINVADMFSNGDRIDVSGISRGKGFQGVMKRFGSSRGPESHGSKYHRRVGALGATGVGRVVKGRKMPGRSGNERVTIKGLKVVEVKAERNLLVLKGSVPGRRGQYVVINKAVDA